jgi:ethanolamine ammonia-lyase small subunit
MKRDEAVGAAIVEDPWSSRLASLTPARIALGRTGASLPTRKVLAFALAHAQARDAVQMPLDAERMQGAIGDLGFKTCLVESAARSREMYLRRPDLGRRLSPASRARLEAEAAAGCDLALVIGDGLSAAAVHAQAAPLIAALRPWIIRAGWRVATVAIARQARVALGDEIGEVMRARAVAVLIGERPGLSSPDSLGIYLTFAPRVGRSDAERNCISNIRREGLAHEVAAFKLAWLIGEALRRQLTGVALKDESDRLLAESAAGQALSPSCEVGLHST